MSSFTKADFEYTGQKRGGRKLYRVLDGFVYDIGYLGSGLSISVPAGFVTDGPSMPVWLGFMLPTKRMTKSACIHDMMRQDLRYSKTEGDALFLTAMLVEKTPWWLRELAFIAVRLNNSRLRAQ